MTFDLDLYLQGHSALNFQSLENRIFGKFEKKFGLHIEKKNIYSSQWILSICSTNDH